MFCPECGKEIPDASRFCLSCGHSMEAIATMRGQQDELAFAPQPQEIPKGPNLSESTVAREETGRSDEGIDSAVRPHTSIQSRTVTALDDSVQIFADRNLTSNIVASLPKGTEVELGDTSAVDGREWIKATLKNGILGFVLGPSARGHTTLAAERTLFADREVSSPESKLPPPHDGTMTPTQRRMARHVKVLAYIALGVGLIFLFGAVAALVPHSPTPGIYVPKAFASGNPAFAALAAIFYVLPFLCVFAGLIRFKRWGRNVSLAIALLGLVVPISWYALWVLTRPESKALFGVLPRPADQSRGCLATGGYVVGAIIVVIFNLGIISAIFKHPTNQLHSISDVITGTGSDTGYCGMDASGKLIPNMEMVRVRGIVPYLDTNSRSYLLVDGASVADGIVVNTNRQFPPPAGDAKLEIMGVVQCSDYPRARFLAEVARFPWRTSPGEDKVISAKGDLWKLRTWLGAYKRDLISFPSTAQGLAALREKPQGVRRWNGPYAPKEIPQDPWGHDYAYRYPGDHGDDPDLICLGADGMPGGEGLSADIVSWKSSKQ